MPAPPAVAQWSGLQRELDDGGVDFVFDTCERQHVEHTLPAPHHVNQLVARTEHDRSAIDHEVCRSDVVAHLLPKELERVTDRLEPDTGIDQSLDDLQLEQVSIGVTAAAARAL